MEITMTMISSLYTVSFPCVLAYIYGMIHLYRFITYMYVGIFVITQHSLS